MDLIASRRYQPDAEEPAEIDYIMMPVSELPVSAGLGAFLEGEMFQQIQVPASSSLTTVISHRKNITEKLGIKSVSGLTIYAVMHGYVEADRI